MQSFLRSNGHHLRLCNSLLLILLNMAILLVVLLSILLYLSPTSAQYSEPHPNPARPCSAVQLPTIQGAKILSVSRTEKPAFTIPSTPSPISVPAICEILINLTHSGVHDNVKVQVWLPLKNWNTRFVAAGGSAWAAGLGAADIGPFVAKGFAAASTDAGLGSDFTSPASWALKDGKVNLGLLENFAARSVKDLAILGAGATQSFYGKKAKRYWNGCSTGGRQGLVAAQRYPELFDGILAGAPAIYWPTYVVAELWPQIVMKEEGLFPSLDELNAVAAKAVQACDTKDGVRDGVITEPEKCDFDPLSVVGKVKVGEKEVEITTKVANIVKKIWDGPRVHGQQFWYGLPIGSPFDYLAKTDDNNGTRVGSPFFIPDTWIRYFLKKEPSFNVSNIDTRNLKDLFWDSQEEYNDLLNNGEPDLSALKHTGGKLIVWHGGADQLIFPQGTTKYRKNVEKTMGGGAKVDKFFRYFTAPGADHCGLGTTPGAAPTNAFEALIAWVENGSAPEALEGKSPPNAPAQFTRKICKYPLVARYKGRGDVNSLESFACK